MPINRSVDNPCQKVLEFTHASHIWVPQNILYRKVIVYIEVDMGGDDVVKGFRTIESVIVQSKTHQVLCIVNRGGDGA